jgi:hypothetical protein
MKINFHKHLYDKLLDVDNQKVLTSNTPISIIQEHVQLADQVCTLTAY